MGQRYLIVLTPHVRVSARAARRVCQFGQSSSAGRFRRGYVAMAIAFSCPCGRKINAKDEQAGKRVKCPACQQPITIPNPSTAKTKSMAAAGAKPAAAA